MRIWWQSSTPIHRLHDYRETLRAHLDAVKRPDTEIEVHGVDEGSMDLHYNAVVAINSFAPGGVLDQIVRAADRGFDAVAIGCFLDPALKEARELVSIPVLGLGETAMLIACMYGHRFSGVAFHSKQAQYYDRKAFEYGLAARHIAFGSLGMDFNEVQTAFRAPEKMTGAFLAEARRLAAAGAEVILAACATVNAIVRRSRIEEVDGALVMDCNAVLLKVTEAMAELAASAGLRASQRLLYRRPERRALDEWLALYGFRPVARARAGAAAALEP
jgi:Asp/Glu/hydantoin racemase